jgi:hypothetical protein
LLWGEMTDEWTPIFEYVESLLKDGKRSQHEDFQTLFRILPGKKKEIVEYAKSFLEKEKLAGDDLGNEK